MNNDKKLETLTKRRDVVIQLVQKYEAELTKIDNEIHRIELDGGDIRSYDNYYDDESPTYITGTEDGI